MTSSFVPHRTTKSEVSPVNRPASYQYAEGIIEPKMPPPAEGFARFVVGPALRTQPDRRLVTLVREGYENAFEEIVRRYGKALTRYAAAIVGGHAEDVTQDAFSKALLALRRDSAEIELRPWLFRIVRNTALNDLRDNPTFSRGTRRGNRERRQPRRGP